MDMPCTIGARSTEQRALGKYFCRSMVPQALGIALWFASLVAFADYTVTPSANANGSIAPATPQTVVPGTSISFTVTPSPGYVAIMYSTCGGSLTGNVFTTDPVNYDCTVVAGFPGGGTCRLRRV